MIKAKRLQAGHRTPGLLWPNGAHELPGEVREGNALMKGSEEMNDMPKYGLEVKDILTIINMLEELKNYKDYPEIDEIQEQIDNLKNIKL